MSTYAWIDLGALLFPFLFSFHPRLRFQQRWPAFALAALGMMGLFIPWDIMFTRAGVWGFNAGHLWGAYLLGLPVEEWLFFVCVPFACVFTYHCLLVLGVKDFLGPHAQIISIVLVFGLLAIAGWNWQRAYTSTAWTLCALWIAFTAFVQKAPWLGRFYSAYLLLLVPFTVVNGLLTGTGLDEAVVWYNGSENLGLRLLTIPIEDIFYGMLMVGLTISIYEAVLQRRPQHADVGSASS